MQNVPFVLLSCRITLLSTTNIFQTVSNSAEISFYIVNIVLIGTEKEMMNDNRLFKLGLTLHGNRHCYKPFWGLNEI